MNYGQGAITFQAKAEAGGSPAPPFDPTSANNGLSVDPVSGKIVLGDGGSGAAALLDSRGILLNGFSIGFLGAGALGGVSISEAVGFDWLSVVAPSAAAGKRAMSIFDDLGNPFFIIDGLTGTFQMGDAGGFGNGVWTNNDSGGNKWEVVKLDNSFILLDFVALTYAIGDLETSNLGTQLFLDDNTGTVTIWGQDRLQYVDGSGAPFFVAAPSVGQYNLGDITGAANNNSFGIDDTTNQFVFNSLGANRLLFADGTGPGALVSLGDLNVLHNGLHFEVDDAGNRIVIDNSAHNVVVQINGTNGFTGTVLTPASITVKGGIVTAVS